MFQSNQKRGYFIFCGHPFGVFLCFVTLLTFFSTANVFAGGRKAKEPTPAVEVTEVIVEVEKIEKPETPMDRIAKYITEGKTDEAKTIFVSEITPNTTDDQGRNVLHYAAEAGNAALADFFIRLGTSVQTQDKSGNTPLNISALASDGETAKIFVANGASIHHRGASGLSSLEDAIYKNDISFLSCLLTEESLVSLDEEGRTALHIASDKGSPQSVATILNDSGIVVLQKTINNTTKQGKTALDLVFSHKNSRNHAESAALLIKSGGISSDPFYIYFAPGVRGLNFNIHASDGNSPLSISVRDQYTGFTSYILDNKANTNIKNTSGITALHEAARIGDLEMMRLLIERGADVNIQDGQGNTAMHIAIPEAVHREALELLLSKRANPNLRDKDGDTPLHIAIRLNRSIDIIETLLSNNADANIHNGSGKTPLYVAVENNRINLIPSLLNHKSDIFSATSEGRTPFELALTENNGALERLITEESVLQIDAGGNTPLLAAIKLGANVEITRLILDKKASVNVRNQEGDTALHIAVRMNQAANSDLLITRGADVFAQNSKGESPVFLTFFSPGTVREWMFTPMVLSASDGLGLTVLHYVTEWKLDNVIPLIASRGASLEAVNVTGKTPLFIAVEINSASTVRALINAGASISGRDTLGNTALHTAVRYNAQAAAEALIDAKININAFNLYGKTALHDSVRLGIFGIENLLVERGANLESRDSDGNTPLMEAIQTGSRRSAEHLLKSGASVSSRNNSGDTPLLISVKNERSDLVGLLLDKNAQIPAKNADGDSPFIIALRTSSRMMLTLLEKGRDQTDNEGRSPLHIAIMYNTPEPEIEKIAAWLGNLDSADLEGRTPLRYAVDRGNWLTAKFLTNSGSDVFSPARDGKSPVEIVLATNNRDAIRAVLGGKAITFGNSSGNTALHFAARLSDIQTVTTLLELGADRTARNTSGETAADIALRWGHPEIAAALQ